MDDGHLTEAETEWAERITRSVFDNRAINRLKRSLVARLGPQKGFAQWRELVPSEKFPDADAIEERPLRSLRTEAEQSPVYVDIAPSGQSFKISPPKVIGDHDRRTLRNTSRALYLTCLADSLVRSGSSATGIDDVVVLDFEGSEPFDTGDALDFDQAIFSYEPSDPSVWFLTPTKPTSTLDEAYSLFGWTALMFGHWWHEYLPKYVMASMTGSLPPAPILINQWMPKTHRESLAYLTPEGVEIVESLALTTTHVRRLWLSSTLNYPAMFPAANPNLHWDLFAPDPARCAPIFQEMVRRFDRAIPSGDGPEKVYLARKPSLRRKLVNSAELEEVAREAGFAVVYPDDLSFAEQFRLMRDASFVVGPEGSGMFLSSLCRPGSKVCILNHTHTENVTITAGVLEALGVDVTVVTGPTVKRKKNFEHFSSYEIDIGRFRKFLTSWCRKPRLQWFWGRGRETQTAKAGSTAP